MKLTLGFSPCPNDTFIFDALVNNLIDTEGIDFDIALEDVETLNQWSILRKLDISKISYGVLPLLSDHYNLLDSGGALGKGVGPLLIARQQIPENDFRHASVAIPGRHTTAHVLFSLAYPDMGNKEFMIFSEIEKAVREGEVDCGVIIHESRFTYMDKGLVKLADLGEVWERKTGCPIPLGGIVMQNKFDQELQKKVSRLIRKSVEFSFLSYPRLSEFVIAHSQEMEENVMRKHIDLYVNNYSISLGEDGKKAVRTFFEVFAQMNRGTEIPKLSLVG